MTGDPDEDEAADWLRPSWATGDALDPPGPPRKVRQADLNPDYGHPLLDPLARATEAVTRLETAAATASQAVAAGLLARLSYREAAGWLAHAHVWIHPLDLALRDSGLMNSYGAAFRMGHLAAEIPWTAAQGAEFETAPSDIHIERALRLARHWRRLAELRTWRPLADGESVLETLKSVGFRASAADSAEWLARVRRQEGPLLIRAGLAARDWQREPDVRQNGPESYFLAACLWADRRPRATPLPFWMAPDLHHARLDLRVGVPWMRDFLECIAAAAQIGFGELQRLQRAEEKVGALRRTKRSRLSDAADVLLRAPVLQARDLARRLAVSPQAALALLRQLEAAEIAHEATGRASFQAFTVRA